MKKRFFVHANDQQRNEDNDKQKSELPKNSLSC